MPPHFQSGIGGPSRPLRNAAPHRSRSLTATNLYSKIQNPKSAIACCLLILLGGCPGPQPGGNGTSGRPSLAGVKLRLLVVGDPQLAAAARQSQGEWNAQTGSEFQVESITEQRFGPTDPLRADALICPSYQLGTLAEQELLRPIPKSLLQGNVGDWSDVFELLRRSEATWAGVPLAVPFGSPVFTFNLVFSGTYDIVYYQYEECHHYIYGGQVQGSVNDSTVNLNLRPARKTDCYGETISPSYQPEFSSTCTLSTDGDSMRCGDAQCSRMSS